MYPMCSKTTFIKSVGQVLWKGEDKMGLRTKLSPRRKEIK